MKKVKAFTLVEVIVVMVILAILAALLLPSLTKYIDKSKETQYIVEARNVYQAAQTAVSDAYGKYGSDFKKYIQIKTTGYYLPQTDEEGNIVHDKNGQIVYDTKNKVQCGNLNSWIFFHTQRNDSSYKKGMQSTMESSIPEYIDFYITQEMLRLLDSYNPANSKAIGSGIKGNINSFDYTYTFYDDKVLGYDRSRLTPDKYFSWSSNPVAFNVRYDTNGHVLAVEFAAEDYDKVIIIINGTVNIEDKVTYSTWK